jgi:hypothetical protein
MLLTEPFIKSTRKAVPKFRLRANDRTYVVGLVTKLNAQEERAQILRIIQS